MSHETTHFDAVYPLLPSSLKSGIDDLLSRATRESVVRHTLDQLVRLALNRDCNVEDLDLREEWNTQRQKVQNALSSLGSGGENGKKRAREEDPLQPSVSDPKAKKVKLGSDSVGGSDDPIFSLHAVSASSPVRKKVHITIHHNSIRFTHVTSGAQEAYIPHSSLTRAFLISTPGKSKPHWTVIILTDAEQSQMIFGLEAVPPSLTTTTHPASPHTNPKGTEAKPAVMQFLSHLPSRVVLQEPSTSIFRSATGEPFLDTYLRAKDGHLLFFKEGLLFGEKKPCMWIGLEVIDNVRSLSATGRTFSLFVTRLREATDGDESEGGEETEFSLIDGKNQDAVARWVQENRHRFGVTRRHTSETQDGTQTNELAAGEDTPETKADEDPEDSDDSDFESDSESDGGSGSSDSSDGGNSGDGGEGQSGSNEEEGEEEEEEEGEGDGDGDGEDEEESLDPSKHPLLAEGAMPRMSKAALSAVVGLVEEDLMSGSAVKRAQVGDDDEDVDELED
ncbi:hypothetical protein JB92DRAFT_3111808 [Gautieria morchelliformis]|nr:hypothetical protein JB92DRAFT_3111808 [Gautieria morchelliformis]